jgi:glycine dehydrogenase
MKVVGIKSDSEGNVDLVDLKEKAKKHAKDVSCLMVTYPSTYGKFEEGVKEAIQIVNEVGGLVYMDGANMNAQLGLTSPGRIGADVCHLNLHKTFAIPHGGGGPGVGSIAVNARLAPFLPGHSVIPVGGEGNGVQKKSTGAVSAAPYGSAGILPIPYMFIRMMGREGLKNASRVAMLNANYMARRLEENGAYKILFKGGSGMVAHEFIVDLRFLKEHHLDETDIAKRLADFGFHAPTMSWPVAGTMMVEPTESEDKGECDRFVNALLEIKKEIDDVVSGRVKAEDSPLKHAPHTSRSVISDKWDRKYSREQAAFPPGSAPLGVKYWPHVGRVDNVHGDRNLVCSCPPVEAFEQ